MKNFIKKMGKKKKTQDDLYLKSKSPKVSEVKLKEGIFIGPQYDL